MSTLDTITDVLSETLDIDASTVTEEATLESLGIDSLDMVELICEIEERCDIEFGEPEGVVTVKDMITHIDSLK